MSVAGRQLQVVQLSFFQDAAARPPAQLLESWTTLADVAEATRGAGLRVAVVQACAQRERLLRNGVAYHFLPFGHAWGGDAYASLGELLHDLAPDVVHVHGLESSRDLPALAALVPEVPIILQDHASRPPRPWRRSLWRRGFSVAAGVAFCAAEQARPFLQAGLLDTQLRVYEIPESTTCFAPGDRAVARRLTGIHGEPALLWVGHLDANKDPLTVLAGVSAAVRALPGLQLFCCFGVAPLLGEVQAHIAADPALRERVTLLGCVPHQRVEQLMRAADIFVLGSRREGSGYSVIEALACSLAPVVTDIPSFRALTGGGAVGALWPCGESRALNSALQAVAARTGASARAAVRAHFERELSPAALGVKLARMYADALARKGGTATLRCAAHDA